MKSRLLCLILCLCMIMVTGLSGCGKEDVSSDNSSINTDSKGDVSDVDSSDASSDDDVQSETSSVDSQAGGSDSTAKVSVNVNKKLKPLTSSGDAIMQDNPDRGFRTHLTLYVDEAVASGDPMSYYQKDYDVFFGYCDMEINVSMTYLYLTAYRGMNIPNEAMAAIEDYFIYSEAKGFTTCLRFAYCDDLNHLERGADQATIIRHIKQLAPLIKKYKHTVHTVEGGFIGSYGEWASVYQSPAVDYETVARALMKYFCMPNGIYLSLRLPKYKNLIPKTDKYYKYIGNHNDAIYGEQLREGWHSGGYQYGTDDYAQMCREGAYTPQGGELLNNGDYVKKGKIPIGVEVVAEAGHHWRNTMSVWHGKYECSSDDDAIMDRWAEESVTPATMKGIQVVFDPYWFIDDKGAEVERNAFEFLRDHLGYRIAAQSVKITGESKPGATVKVEMPIKNYGFSAAFCMTSGFAILDSDYNVVSTVKAGSPSKWYSHDPENYLDTTILTHNVSANVKLPSKSGKYYVAFYLKNGINQFATLANDIETADGYALLHEFVI